ncbi:MAG: alpha/beta hydrolase [Candidatus Nomurabacteria bacterium]|jgi:pimeloyl-ACP methyl ester carboxylesterase|nr:alpha/beta hydrolase [Candidatus Nomurabacteria bacterium]
MTHTIDIDGRRAAIWEYGKKNQPDIWLIHGFRGTHSGLADIARNLPEFHRLIPDLPAFGQSQPLPNSQIHSAENYAKWLIRAVEKIGGAPVILFGHSFGSIIASIVAATRPDLVSWLVLAAPIAQPSRRHFNSKISDLYFKLGQILPKNAGEKWLRVRFATDIMSFGSIKTKNRRLRREIYARHRTHFSDFYSRQTVLETYRSASRDAIWPLADQIHTPTLIISGDKDRIAPFKEAEALARQIPGAEFCALNGVGHILQHEAPAAVAALIKNFCQPEF